jgi:hypothetical protein
MNKALTNNQLQATLTAVCTLSPSVTNVATLLGVVPRNFGTWVLGVCDVLNSTISRREIGDGDGDSWP